MPLLMSVISLSRCCARRYWPELLMTASKRTRRNAFLLLRIIIYRGAALGWRFVSPVSVIQFALILIVAARISFIISILPGAAAVATAARLLTLASLRVKDRALRTTREWADAAVATVILQIGTASVIRRQGRKTMVGADTLVGQSRRVQIKTETRPLRSHTNHYAGTARAIGIIWLGRGIACRLRSGCWRRRRTKTRTYV